MGIPDPESKENDDLGLMPPVSQLDFHAISHFFQVVDNYCQVSYQTGAMTPPNLCVREVERGGLRL